MQLVRFLSLLLRLGHEITDALITDVSVIVFLAHVRLIAAVLQTYSTYGKSLI